MSHLSACRKCRTVGASPPTSTILDRNQLCHNRFARLVLTVQQLTWVVRELSVPCILRHRPPEMAPHHDRNHRTWRDLADQLDTDQIGTLAEREDEFSCESAPRMWAADNLLQVFYADVPEPAEATSVHPWDEAADGTVDRGFAGTERVITPTIRVWID